MKTLWAVACAGIVSAGVILLVGGCASTGSQVAESPRTVAGGGPGNTLRQLTELQKSGGEKPTATEADQTPAALPYPGTASASATERPSSTPVKAETPSQAVQEKTAQKATPPARSSRAGKKRSPSKEIARIEKIENNQTTDNRTASASVAAPAAPPPTPASVAMPVQEKRVEPPPVRAPSPPATLPSSEIAGSGAEKPAQQASVSGIPPAVAPVAPTGRKGLSSADDQYRIGPEDVLHVSVWGNEQLTMDVIVRPDGKISIPLVQDIQADGFTAAELSDRIHEKLLPYIKDPNVSVIVKEINAPKFSVIGYVNRPGTFPIRGEVTVLQALSSAGGFTPFASPRKIKLVRNAGGKQEIRVFNYYRMIEEGGKGNVLLMPGDTIVVP